MATRLLTIEVDAAFANPWFETEATPGERTASLEFACALPRHADDGARACRAAVDSATQALTERVATALSESQRDEAKMAREAEAVARREAALDRARADALERSAADVATRARADAEASATERVRGTIDALRADLNAAHADRLCAEQEFAARLRETSLAHAASADECLALRARVSELETPMGRGRAGEVDVEDALRGVGFEVRDTSTGDYKMRGFLDLLAWPEGVDEDAAVGARLAIECKNCAVIDPRTHLDVFERKAREGIAAGLFDAAVFVSLRAHTKRDGALLSFVADADGRELAPVSYVGPERGKHAAPLSREQLEAHVCLHAALLAQCAALCRGLSTDAVTDRDVACVRECVTAASEELTGTLEDLQRQHRLLKDLQTLVSSMRARCVRAFVQIHRANADTPWLQQPLGSAPWLPAFDTLQRRVAEAPPGTKDATLWNNVAKEKKALLEKHVGQEAVFASLKRPRDE